MATEYERRLQLLDRLDIGIDPALVAAFQLARAKLAFVTDKERRRELEKIGPKAIALSEITNPCC